MSEKKKLIIEIDNLTEAQAIAIEDMLATWQKLGRWGSDRVTCFYAAGDSDFRPKILVNGEKPQETKYLTANEKWFKQVELHKHNKQIANNGIGDTYYIDYDKIAWRLDGFENKLHGWSDASKYDHPYVPHPEL